MNKTDQIQKDGTVGDESAPFRAFDWPMHHIMMAFVQHMNSINYVLKEHGIDQRIWRILTQISELGTPTVQALATAGGFDRSTLSKILLQAEELGLIERKADDKDRRRANLTLTKEGAAKITQCTPHVVNLLEAYLVDFSSEEKEMLMGLIRRLRTNVEVEGALIGRRIDRF